MKEQPNLSYIHQLSGRDPVFEEKLISIIKKEFPEEKARYFKHLEEKNYKLTAEDVHKLKHKISILGLEASYYLAENYENCGQGIAQHPCNFKLQDQYGKSWQLYDHRGSIIVLDFSTMWCGVCMHAATKIENILEDYEGHNIIWVTVLLQDQYGNLPTLDLIKLWARTFEIENSPVLVGDLRIAKAIVTGEYDVTVLPTMVIIDQEMTIQYIMEGWNEGRFRVYLDSLI